ncbi:putative O-methyltransferase 3, partial [Mucuna pruriens]
MDFDKEYHCAKLLRSQTHILNHTFSFIKSMSLKCAIDLCIPDVIHKYGQPMPLSQLIASLPIHPSKTHNIHRLMRCKEVFQGLESLVDVGGGTGTMAKAIAESFPQLKCIVFDLPHVVDGLHGPENVKYVGGNMFEAIPFVDCIILKWILHNWNDEECSKILKNCKEAITSKDKGKVIIIDMVIGNEKGDSELDETKLFYDIEMMQLFTGKERNEKDWAKLIFSAGFNNYKIIPVLGLKSLIEVYP